MPRKKLLVPVQRMLKNDTQSAPSLKKTGGNLVAFLTRLKFSLPVISFVPGLIFCVFTGLAAYSFVLLLSDESGLRRFNIGIIQDRAALVDFQLAAQETIGQLYELTSTAGNEIDPEKVKTLQVQTLKSLQQLDTDHDALKTMLTRTRIDAAAINSFDSLMKSYKGGASDVIEMATIEPSTAMSWMTQTRRKFSDLDELLDRMRLDLTIKKDDELNALTNSMTEGRYVFAAIILAASLLVVFLVFILRRFVTTIDTLNASMTAMLDSLGQGLLFFDAKGICSPVFSKACLTLLETDPANKPVADILKLGTDKRALFEATLQMLYADKLALGFSEWVALAPASYDHSGDLAIGLTYRPIMGADGALKSILLVATDRTQEKIVESIIQANETAALRTLRIFRNRNQFIRFVQNFGAYIVSPSTDIDTAPVEQIRRDIHTLKGTAATFHLDELAQVLHVLETDMQEAVKDLGAILDAHRPALMQAFDNSMYFAREILGEDFQSSGQVRTIPETRLYAFAQRMQSALTAGISAQQICQLYVQEMMAVPIWNLLDDFAMTLQELADRFGKPLNPCVFTGDNFSILPKIYEPLFASFVHIARNIIDHGIETAIVRQQRRKPTKATVTVRTRTFTKSTHDWFAIEFIDDGGGIDVNMLREALIQKLQRQDLAKLDDHALIQHIFDAKVSTKGEATLISGRGVGLNAVKAETAELGGTIVIFSTCGAGVTLRIELPLLQNPQPAQPRI